MSKKIISPIIVVLFVLQIFMISSHSFATGAEVGDKTLLYVTKKIEGITMSYYGQEVIPYYTVYKKDGVEYPAYCVDYFHGGVTDSKSYEVQVTEEYVNEDSINESKLGVWRAIINGYPFKSYQALNCEDNYEAYAATKQAVFCMLYNRDLKLYTYEGEAGKRVYDAMQSIVEIARNSNQSPKNTSIDITETDWKVDNINKQYLSKEITLNCENTISEFSVTLEGKVPEGTLLTDLDNMELNKFKNCQKFKILVPLEKLNNEDEFTVNVQSKVNAYPMYFGQSPSSNLQSYVLTAGVTKTEIAGTLIQYPKNTTRIVIKKQDTDGNNLMGVKFNVLNENGDVVYENLETNKDGIIEINNVVPGIYYIQEIETIEGYEIFNKKVQINVELYEEKEIAIENKKIPEEPEKPEEVEVPPQYDVPGILETPELPCLPRTGW